MVGLLKYINLRDPNDRLLVYSLLILKKVLILYFIAIIFMFFVSFFTKANNEKIIEGNWFDSPAQKRRKYQAELDRIARIRAAQERERQRCLISTNENWVSCGPKYFFPEAHFKQGADQANAKTRKDIANSEQQDRGLTQRLVTTVNDA